MTVMLLNSDPTMKWLALVALCTLFLLTESNNEPSITQQQHETSAELLTQSPSYMKAYSSSNDEYSLRNDSDGLLQLSVRQKQAENNNNISSNNTSSSGNSTNGARKFETVTSAFILICIIYGLISLISVFGNLLIILVVMKDQRMQNVTNYFICNLAMADIVIGIFVLPFQFQAAYLQRWIFPDIMCKIVPFASTLSVNVSIITLVAISLDRYYVILHPFKQKLKIKQCIFILILIWIVSVLIGAVKLVNFVVEEGQCTTRDYELEKYENLFLAIAQYLVPFIIISYTYFRIGYHIYFDDSPSSVTDQGKNKRKVIKMVFIVVTLFMICWFPLHMFNILNVFSDRFKSLDILNYIWYFVNSLALSNSCYNVFIYGLCSARYQRAFKRIFSCLPCVDKDINDLECSNLARQYSVNMNNSKKYSISPNMNGYMAVNRSRNQSLLSRTNGGSLIKKVSVKSKDSASLLRHNDSQYDYRNNNRLQVSLKSLAGEYRSKDATTPTTVNNVNSRLNLNEPEFSSSTLNA